MQVPPQAILGDERRVWRNFGKKMLCLFIFFIECGIMVYWYRYASL